MTLAVQVRRATLADAAAMAALELATALEAYAEFFPADAPPPDPQRLVRRWESRLSQDARTASFCAVDADGTIVGTACGQPDPEQPDRGYLCSLYVRPALWGDGVGRQLHDAVVDHLRDAGFAEATLWVIEKNVRTRAVYERWGWRLVPDRLQELPGVDEVRYCRDLG